MKPWERALEEIRARGYRERNGKYEAYVSNHSKTIMLGTHKSAEDAKNTVMKYRSNRLIENLGKHGLHPDDGVIYKNDYLAFKNGMIFNLHGEQICGGIGKGGYRHGIVAREHRDFHKIIADSFIDNPNDLRDVNHKNGNKLDISVTNLERTTHSDNIIHAYKNGLIHPQIGEAHHNSKLTESDVRYIRSSDVSSYQLSKELGVDSSTIRDIRRRKTWRHIK